MAFFSRRAALSSSAVRARMYVLALILAPLNTLWVQMCEVVRYSGHPTTISLFFNVVFLLCALTAGNAVVARILPRACLNRSELLGLYFVLGITSAISGHDTSEVMLPLLAYPARMADGANGWAQNLFPFLPKGFTVSDKDALAGFFEGHADLWGGGWWRAWIGPVSLWCGFFFALFWVMLCLNQLLRQQWTQSEKLDFPLIRLPLAITEPGAPLLRERFFWGGVAVASGLQIYNGLATLDPRLPLLPLKATDYAGLFTGRPWSAVGWFPVSLYPFGVALGVLLPLEMSFSSWFFFLFWKAQFVVSAALGWDQIRNFPYVTQQSLGAYLGIAFTALWAARGSLARAFDVALGQRAEPEDQAGPLGSRAAVWGAVVGIGVLAVYCIGGGMRPLIFGAFMVLYFGIAIALTRMRAELGAPVHDLHDAGPDVFLPAVLGPAHSPRPELAFLSMCWGFNRAYRGHPMPIQIEAMKAFQVVQTPERRLLPLLVFAGILAPLCGLWGLLHLSYAYGANAGMGPPNVLSIFGGEAWNRYTSYVKTPSPPDANQFYAMLVGFGFSWLLGFLRTRFIGFPFHPVGYAVASSWGMSVLWFPMLLAWIIKKIILTYGGLPLYRRLLPFWYGILVGECVVGSLWTLIGIGGGIPTYGFWP